MTYGLHDSTIHLAKSNLRINRSSCILQSIELLYLDFSCLDVYCHLGEVGSIRN